MDFGYRLPTAGPLATPESIQALARRGEELGFRVLAIADHVVQPNKIASRYPYSATGAFTASGGDWLEQLTLMSYVAGITSKAKLITSVMVVPHRPAILTAKVIASIDVLSGGRVIVGIGAGWMKEEFDALQLPPFAERGKVTDEYLAAFKALWTEEKPSFDGRYVKFSDIIFAPKPVQKPHPPIWIGGESPAALRRLIRYGDGWYPIGVNPQFPLNTAARFGEGVSRMQNLARQQGRDPASIALGFWANWYVENQRITLPTGERQIFTGNANEIADDAKRVRDIGVGTLMFNFVRPTLKESISSIETWARDVRPKIGE